MADKPKAAICWLGACGGCDEAIVDMNEAILQVADVLDLVLWPIAMDYKYHHVESLADGEISFCILAGSVRNSEHQKIGELLRKKSQLVLGLGSCACFGGTPGLANFRARSNIFDWVYRDAPTVVNPQGHLPQKETLVDEKLLTLPEFYDHVFALGQVIDVDYYLPGCPPPADLTANAIKAFLSGDLPPRGSTLAPRKALCDSCARNSRKPYRIGIEQIRRIHQVEADPDKCFLEQGIICLGPATRTGCGETCIRINVPCRGCFGPVPGVSDSGAKFISALASLIQAEKDEDVKKAIDTIDDPAGYFFRFTQPTSILGKKKTGKVAEG